MADKPKAPLRPTVVVPPDRPRRAAAGPAAAPSPAEFRARKPTGPTMIRGTAPEQMEVADADLLALSPAARKPVIARAIVYLRPVTLAKLSERKAILWGQDLQQSYGRQVAETLSVAQSPAFQRAESYLLRFTAILKSIDVMAACGQSGPRLLRSLNSVIDTPEELAAARLELDQLAKLMNDQLTELLTQRDRLLAHRRITEDLAVDIEASSLAALHLSDLLRTAQPEVSRLFTDRSMSLTQTLAQIRSNAPVTDLQSDHMVRLTAMLQQAVLVSLPDLIASIAAVTQLAHRSSGVSRTEAGELKRKIDTIAGQLKL